jgi:Nucleotidyltransferase domain
MLEGYGVKDIRLFGSVARGEAGVGSDVDATPTDYSCYLLFLLIILWHVYPDPFRLNDPELTFDALFV